MFLKQKHLLAPSVREVCCEASAWPGQTHSYTVSLPHQPLKYVWHISCGSLLLHFPISKRRGCDFYLHPWTDVFGWNPQALSTAFALCRKTKPLQFYQKRSVRPSWEIFPKCSSVASKTPAKKYLELSRHKILLEVSDSIFWFFFFIFW